MSIPPDSGWVLARLMSDLTVTSAELAGMSATWRTLADLLASSPPAERVAVLRGHSLSSLGDPDALGMALAVLKPSEPRPDPEVVPPRRFATCADIGRLQPATPWVWEGWIPSSRIVGVAAAEGMGKTRFVLDLARRAWHGEVWPDGQAMTLPAESPSLWVAADGQHDELAQALPALGMPPEAIVFPTAPDDPYGGTSLDEPETIEALDEACRIYRPAFLIVDSLTYATRWDIGEQRAIATLKEPLVRLAQTHQLVVMLLLHVSKEGQALGRRIKGITRTLMHLDAPDPARPERLRLWMEKTFAARPPALGVTIGPTGNTYDADPPAPRDPARGGRPPAARDKAIAFLSEKLADGERKGCELISEWEAAGGSKPVIFAARDAMQADGRLVVDNTVKPQIWHFVRAAS